MANNEILYGFVGLESLFSEKLEDVNVEVVATAIQQSLDEHNRQVQAATGDMFAFTTEYKVRFQQPGAGTLQPLDEWGVPLPTRPSGYYDVAFPIHSAGDSFGANRVAAALQTVGDVNRHLADVLQRDANWIRRHMLAALLDNTTWSYDDPAHGTLTIQPLALASDGVKYLKRSGTLATDTHHLAQAAAVADATSPFSAIYSDLSEHPVNANAPIVAYIPSNIVDDVTGLAAFTEIGDPDIQPGANTATVNGRIDRGWGDEVLGKVDKVWVVEAGILPDNYIVANARGAAPALWARQYPAASLQGLQRKEHDVNGNIMQSLFYRDLGFGAYNRVGAMVYFVEAGDTTYDIPTGYTNPLAV